MKELHDKSHLLSLSDFRDSAGFQGYANSKLATLLAAKEWNRRFRDCNSRQQDMSVAVHPGLVNTELARGWLTGADVSGMSTLKPAPATFALSSSLHLPYIHLTAARLVWQSCVAAALKYITVATACY